MKRKITTLFLIIIFPASFYFIAGYSESLFLTLSLTVIILSRRRQWIWAGIFAALATLSRVQGILLTVPIFVELVQDYRTRNNLKDFLTGLCSLSYSPFVYELYSLYIYFGLKVDWPWNTLAVYWDQHFSYPWLGFLGTASVLFGKYVENDNTPGIIKSANLLLSFSAIFFFVDSDF